ncbi:hypothetical protein JEP98_04290 [Providencia rettgeri]|uniref:hypothetical protein n=2 Tax=Morganellaceae TaxID=1903414 RepID=UPI0018E4B4DF|nr:hypothetical protein [Providencia rettgeri]MBI6188383.1 hypothetical protein [Providencia rettgeri]
MMKKTLLARIFIMIVILTGFSIAAQAANNTVLTEIIAHNKVAYEYVLQNTDQNEADIEFEREAKELDSSQLRNIVNDKRFTGRQFRIQEK